MLGRLPRLLTVLLLATLLTPYLERPGQAAAAPWDGKRFQFAERRFEAAWRQADAAVAEGRTTRSWTWGPTPWFDYREYYQQAPDGLRLVQYFDKTRMEINNPADTTGPLSGVTNGLLPVELISGRVKLGDGIGPDQNDQREPATIPVAGDLDIGPENPTPTYATFRAIATVDNGYRDPNKVGQRIGTTLDKDGRRGESPELAGDAGTLIVSYENVTGHNVPRVFQDFLNAGPVPAIVAFGYPITDPYWTQAKVGGQARTVLVQIWERRVLTYTPANPAQYKVEMGNVGQHYFAWRYGSLGRPWVEQEPALPIVYASKEGGPTWDVYQIEADGRNPLRLTRGEADTIPWSVFRGYGLVGPRIVGDSRRFSDRREIAVEGYLLPRHPDVYSVIAMPGNAYEPAVSPVSGPIAFVSDTPGLPQLYLAAGRQGPIQLTSSPDCRYGHPSWLPDGSGLVYERQCIREPWTIWRAKLRVVNVNPDRTEVVLVEPQRLVNTAGDNRWPRVSPDGSRVAFWSTRDGHSEVFSMQIDGTDQRRLSSHAGRDEAPTWSADGTQLAFNSDRDGDFEIWVMRSDGSEQRQLTFNNVDDGYAIWAQ